MDKYTGKKLDGRYEIHELIGMGGMAVVYRAYDTIDDRTVAIKILKEEYLNNEEFIRRFKNESKAIAVMSHPNIVKVYDVSFGDRIQYIVMEYIDGITLKEYIEQQHDIKWKEAVHFTAQILRALQHAHSKGIIHRDIKPQNIMLLQDGTIKVTDFGIARFSRNDTRTMTDKAIGSVHYIAPEQARGELTDEKADIYSVGVMLYEMLTGQLPFEADNAVSVAIMQLQTDPRPPKDINPAIPDGLEDITLKAMQKEPARRYQNASEMLNDLEQFRKNPNMRFQYQYFVDEKPTQMVSSLNNTHTTSPVPVPDYEDGFDYEEEEDAAEAKKPKSPVVHILGGVGIAVILIAIVIGIMAISHSCETETVKDVEIPNFVGQLYEDVLKQGYKFDFIVENKYDANAREGEILSQNPEHSSKLVKENTQVKLVVNSSKDGVPVPDVKSLKQDVAIQKLKDQKFVPEVQLIPDENTASGVVIATDPAANTTAPEGSKVVVYVSKGPEQKKVKIPKLINEKLDDVKRELEGMNLKVSVNEINSDSPAGTILECNPLEYAEVDEGTTVYLTVSNGKPKMIEKEIHIQLRNSIDYSVELQMLLDGEPYDTVSLIPANIPVKTVTVSGESNSGVKSFVVKIFGQTYMSCTIDFNNDGKIENVDYNADFQWKDPNTSSEPPQSSSTPENPSSQSSSNPDEQGNNSQPNEELD